MREIMSVICVPDARGITLRYLFVVYGFDVRSPDHLHAAFSSYEIH